MAPPAYHPYQMRMVQNGDTKGVEDSDMLPPHFNGQLGSYDEWVEKLHQLFGLCYVTYREANEARMILSTLPPWLRKIINRKLCEATQHTQTPPCLREVWDFSQHRFNEYDASRANERRCALSPGVFKGQVSFNDLEEFYNR